MDKPFLTIGIPTYNRFEALKNNVDKLLSANLPNDIQILVIDNNSTDDTFQYLEESFQGKSNYKVISNSKNIGFAKNLLKLIEESNTEYIITTSDEDIIDINELPGFIEFLKRKKPSLTIPQVFVYNEEGRKLYRGSSKNIKVEPEEIIKATNYISGLTIRLHGIKPILDFLNSKYESCEYLQLYPQVLLSVLIGLRGRNLWYSREMTKKIYQLNNTICSESGNPFNHLNSRWEQIKSFSDFFTDLIENERKKKNRLYYEAIKNGYLENLFNYIKKAILYERPEFHIYTVKK